MPSTIGLSKTTDAFTKQQPADSSAGFLSRKWLQVRSEARLTFPKYQTRDAAPSASSGQRDNALEILTSIYSRFSEGFQTLDLVSAAKLLDELRSRTTSDS